MLRYVVSTLGPETPQQDKDRLVSALEEVKGLKDVQLTPDRHEITFGISGAEPKVRLLQEACTSAGFELGPRV